MRVVQIALVAALALAVLAFGGTEPISMAVVQVVLFLLAIFLVGSQGRIQKEDRFPMAVPMVLLGLALLQVLPLFSLGTSGEGQGPSALSLAAHASSTRFLLLLAYGTAFYATLVVGKSRDGMRFLVYSLLFLGLFEAFYGLVQYLTGWQQIFTYVKKYSLDDATGTYINRNHFAGFLEMVIPFSVSLSFYHLRRSSSSSPSRGGARLPVLIFWPFFSAVLLVALVFSRSRMGIIATLCAFLLMLSLTVSTAVRKGAAIAFSAVLLLAGAWMAIWIGPEPVLGRFESLDQEITGVEGSRAEIWKDTVQLIEQRPLIGSGLGSFPVVYTSVQTTFLSKFVNSAHNDYLEFAADVGLVGTVVLFGSVLVLLFQSARAFLASRGGFQRAVALGCAGSIAAILLHSLTDFNLQIPANALTFAVILGLACSVRMAASGERPEAALGGSEAAR
jgi:O-antigen ligase